MRWNYLVDSGWFVFNDYWGMVATVVVVLKSGVGFVVELVSILGKIECDIYRIKSLLVSFDCDFQFVVFENAANAGFMFSVIFCVVFIMESPLFL